MNTAAIVRRQRAFFETGWTRDLSHRLSALRRLKRGIKDMREDIYKALSQDLGKSRAESYMSEVGMVLSEISYMEKHLLSLSRPRLVPTPLAQFPSASYILREPYGTVLIMSPWNYPFMLALEPAVDAIAAGNTVVIKPGSYSSATSQVLEDLITTYLPPQLAAVIQGGRDVNQDLLDQKFDYIFFTGGKTVGRLVMEKAAAHLTPITLELGGKSPCIVDASANLKVAAQRIVFGKFLNLGQTCVAPDYILVHESMKKPLLLELKIALRKQFGDNPLANPDYGHIINEKHFKRLLGLLEGETPYVGGQHDGVNRIAPTILDQATLDSPAMQEEIFGPILPVLTFRTWPEARAIIQQNPTPLALYLFTEKDSVKKWVLHHIQFGGGCVNDTLIHLATSHMGFGGVGTSGMGSYHGKHGFDTFTHDKSIVDKATWLDLPVRYQPYHPIKYLMLQFFLR